MQLIEEFTGSPLLIGVFAALFISASITTFDKRLIQGKRSGSLPPDHPNLPRWVIIFHILDWALLITLIFLNWKIGLIAWALLFALKVLPVLELIGNFLMAPFKSSATDRDKIF